MPRQDTSLARRPSTPYEVESAETDGRQQGPVVPDQATGRTPQRKARERPPAEHVEAAATDALARVDTETHRRTGATAPRARYTRAHSRAVLSWISSTRGMLPSTAF